jgi:anti-anti-sigma factor
MAFHRSELEPFRCEVAPHRDEVLVRPVGELDLATVPMVDEQLSELSSAGFTRLVLDLRSVRFLDSTGLRMLLAWNGRSTNDASPSASSRVHRWSNGCWRSQASTVG